MNIHIRKTEETDWIALKELRLESLNESPKAFGLAYANATQFTDTQWQDSAACKTPPTYFMAWYHLKAIALIGGAISNGEYNLIAMWVSPKNRGLGIAEKLIHTALFHAQEIGHSNVVLSVSPENIPANRLYEKMGFHFIEQYEQLKSHPDIKVQKMVANIGGL